MADKQINELTSLSGNPSSSDYLIIHDGSAAKKVAMSSFNQIRSGSKYIEIDSNKIGFNGSFIPDTNASYDLGSAEYKIRHLFLSDNSLWIGDEHKVDISDGELKIKKRDKSSIPNSIVDAGGSAEGAVAFINDPAKTSVSQLTTNDLIAYLDFLTGGSGSTEIGLVFPEEGDVKYKDDDWSEIIPLRQSGKLPAYSADFNSENNSYKLPLFKSKSFLINHTANNDDYLINIAGVENTEGNTFDFDIYCLPTTGNISATGFITNTSGPSAVTIKVTGDAPNISSRVDIVNVKGIYINSEWYIVANRLNT